MRSDQTERMRQIIHQLSVVNRVLSNSHSYDAEMSSIEFEKPNMTMAKKMLLIKFLRCDTFNKYEFLAKIEYS